MMSRSSVTCLTMLYVFYAVSDLARGAPLEPRNTSINVSINGNANIDTTSGPISAQFDQSGSASDFTSGGTFLSATVTAGGTPAVEHNATAGASAGVQFEQISHNEFVLTLTSTATGDLLNADPSTFLSSDFDGHSSVQVDAEFEVLGLPGQPVGFPATIILSLEHFGTLSKVNSGSAGSDVDLSVNAPSDSFDYQNLLITPPIPVPPDGFQEIIFTGVRDVVTAGSLVAAVGDVFHLSANFGSDASAMLDMGSPFPYMAASGNSSFEAGIRLHMTVLPEPATIGLLAVGGLGLLRRRTA